MKTRTTSTPRAAVCGLIILSALIVNHFVSRSGHAKNVLTPRPIRCPSVCPVVSPPA